MRKQRTVPGKLMECAHAIGGWSRNLLQKRSMGARCIRNPGTTEMGKNRHQPGASHPGRLIASYIACTCKVLLYRRRILTSSAPSSDSVTFFEIASRPWPSPQILLGRAAERVDSCVGIPPCELREQTTGARAPTPLLESGPGRVSAQEAIHRPRLGCSSSFG